MCPFALVSGFELERTIFLGLSRATFFESFRSEVGSLAWISIKRKQARAPFRGQPTIHYTSAVVRLLACLRFHLHPSSPDYKINQVYGAGKRSNSHKACSPIAYCCDFRFMAFPCGGRSEEEGKCPFATVGALGFGEVHGIQKSSANFTTLLAVGWLVDK
ncbi:unnamed protein product [Protopolystoma xenopodis]|uniref:Uncharacterized protein n=1 Tax=Protopolystoma xenopodis TaxID=117903 RepID=A0A448WCR0_9PLAT|nr:unnamed protein product [Protopolystoma xenopodis]